jgi:hypothetical protein
MPDQEHKRFLDAVKCFGSHNHKAIAAYVETRSAAQVRYTPRETTPFKPHPTPYNLDHTPYPQHSTPYNRYTPRVIGLRIQRDQRGTVRLSTLLLTLPPSSCLCLVDSGEAVWAGRVFPQTLMHSGSATLAAFNSLASWRCDCWRSLSSELGTQNTVKARFWPWMSGQSR